MKIGTWQKKFTKKSKDIMKNSFKIALLSTYDHPLLHLYINAVIEQKFNDIVVICDRDQFSKKNKDLWLQRTGGAIVRDENFIEDMERKINTKIPFYFVDNHNDKKTLDLINLLSINVLLNAGTPRKLKREILNASIHGVVNIHPGELPKYRGCSAVEWSIFYEDKVCNTAHFMSEDYDNGSIICSEYYEFSKEATYESIRTKVYQKGCILAGKALKIILQKRIRPDDGIPQDEKKAKYRKPITDDKFREVIKKINLKKYKYQKL